MSSTIFTPYVVEFLSTILFVYSSLALSNLVITELFLKAFVFGSLQLLGSTLGGPISLNPMVTIPEFLRGKITSEQFIPFLILEIFGGLIGFEIYKRFNT